MYYNKMEAIQERGVAEILILSNDYVGARGKLLKAQKLFPALDHINAMMAVCDILSASNNKVPGYDVDHYWVLQLMPSSSLSDVRSRYQKLASLLQPIKNKVPKTDLALKLIDDAFCVLSDEEKRYAFDMKRGTSWESYIGADDVSGEKTDFNDQVSSGCVSVSSGELLDGRNEEIDVLPESTKDFGSKSLTNYDNKERHDDIRSPQPNSFSSEMSSRKKSRAEIDIPMHDINTTLEVDRTALKENLSWSHMAVAQTKVRNSYYDFENYRHANSFEKGQIWAAHYNSHELWHGRYARIISCLESEVSVTWLKPVPITQGERRWCDAGLPVGCGSFCLDPETTEELSTQTSFSYLCSWVPGISEEQIEIYPKKGEVWALYENWDLDEWAYNPESINDCKFKLVEIISDFSKYSGVDCACLTMVNGFRNIFQRRKEEGNPVVLHISPHIFYMLSHLVPSYRFRGGEIGGVVSGMFELDQSALPSNVIQGFDSQITPSRRKSDGSTLTSPVDQQPSPTESRILGPNWSPSDFIAGQVWAVYWGRDLMPRRYARVSNVAPENQVSVTFLEHQLMLDHEINWKKRNYPSVCGIFKAVQTNVNIEISLFSHLVQCQQSTSRSVYKIYPMKGEIWAMYKDWDSKWKHSDYENHQCWIVEILSDLSENGMMIARLGEVKGCLTFFHRQQHDGFDLIRTVSKSEMVSFSHQIPAFRVPGIGEYGIPESSWHLEPDALPPNCGNLI